MKSKERQSLPAQRELFQDDFKKMIFEQYLEGNLTMEKIRVKFNIKGNSSLLVRRKKEKKWLNYITMKDHIKA